MWFGVSCFFGGIGRCVGFKILFFWECWFDFGGGYYYFFDY